MAADSLRIICGPTAAGKSRLALDIAEHYGAAIISADSRQIYRGFDVGTAKPSAAERARVSHYGIDIVDPTERYSAARWATDARAWVMEVPRSGKIPLVVGGTGLYIKALVNPLFTAPAVDASRRAALESELGGLSTPELRRWCKELDPARAHLGRVQLQRAIETALLAGSRISDLHAADRAATAKESAVNARYLIVDPGTSLHSRIEARVDSMMESGWPGEVDKLLRRVPADAPAWKASGYGAIRAFIGGECDLSSARERVIIETRQYAKRQRTWFRHQLSPAAVTRVNPDEPDYWNVVRDWWEKTE